jgi:hypothetical protein
MCATDDCPRDFIDYFLDAVGGGEKGLELIFVRRRFFRTLNIHTRKREPCMMIKNTMKQVWVVVDCICFTAVFVSYPPNFFSCEENSFREKKSKQKILPERFQWNAARNRDLFFYSI